MAPLDQIPSLEAFLAGARPVAQAGSATALKTLVRARQFQVIRATAKEELLARVGDRVAVVGQVIDVALQQRYGRNYAFINFDDWRQGPIRLVVWSDTLKKLALENTSVLSLKDRWISITGLMEGCTPTTQGSVSRRATVPQIIVDEPTDICLLSGERETLQILSGEPTTVFQQSLSTPARVLGNNDKIRQELASRRRDQSTDLRPRSVPAVSTGTPLSKLPLASPSPTHPQIPSKPNALMSGTPPSRNAAIRQQLQQRTASPITPAKRAGRAHPL